MPESWAAKTVLAQQADPDSLLALYRRTIAARRWLPADGLAWLPSEPGVLHFRRGSIEVVVNLSGDPVTIPGGRVVVSSEPVVKDLLPDDAAVWVETA